MGYPSEKMELFNILPQLRDLLSTLKRSVMCNTSVAINQGIGTGASLGFIPVTLSTHSAVPRKPHSSKPPSPDLSSARAAPPDVGARRGRAGFRSTPLVKRVCVCVKQNLVAHPEKLVLPLCFWLLLFSCLKTQKCSGLWSSLLLIHKEHIG